MTLTENSWILAAISIPLTTFTIDLWWAWVYFTEEMTDSESSNHSRLESFRLVVSSSKNSFKNLSIFGRKRRELDIEGGVNPPSNIPPLPHSSKYRGTW